MQHPARLESSEPVEAFPTDPTGLPEATRPAVLDLADGEVLDLAVGPVAKRLGDTTVRMLSYNGSIPGPTLKVRQGNEIAVNVTNHGDLDTTVHWHGLRLENRFDGVPHDTQAPIPVGGSFAYRVQFPDPGLYWYHPHIREDYTQELGLYGNVFLVGGEPDPSLSARAGEVVRLWLTNTANTRVFNVRLPGARMKLEGGDSGRVERHTFVDEVLLAPSERAVVDVLVDEPGELVLEHRTPNQVYRLATMSVSDERTAPAPAREFDVLREAPELVAERRQLERWLAAPPDKILALVARMDDLSLVDPDGGPVAYVCPMHPEVTSDHPGRCPKCGMKLLADAQATGHADDHDHDHQENDHSHDPDDTHQEHDHDHEAGHAHDHVHGTSDGIEWEDDMVEVNRLTTPANMHWSFLDRTTGEDHPPNDWRFTVGDRVKIRLVNEMDSDHPMHHPFHLHGAGRFLVLTRGGVTEPNLVWKDTVLVRTGQTVNILFDVTNPGLWMAHCHIAEHMESGMMFSFTVAERQPV